VNLIVIVLDCCWQVSCEIVVLIFEGCASAAGPLRTPTAQQIGGPADCCSVEAGEDSSFVFVFATN
jgi:hypothetical protein